MPAGVGVGLLGVEAERRGENKERSLALECSSALTVGMARTTPNEDRLRADQARHPQGEEGAAPQTLPLSELRQPAARHSAGFRLRTTSATDRDVAVARSLGQWRRPVPCGRHPRATVLG